MNTTKPKEGDLRVYNFINPPCEPDVYPVAGPTEAAERIGRMANAQLKDNRIVCNVFGLEVYEGGEWCEWYDGEGRDIDEWAEAMKARRQ